MGGGTAGAVQTALEALCAESLGLVHMRLPDGEIGRPGDNLYRVSYMVTRPLRLLVELEDAILLVVTGAELAAVEQHQLSVDFVQLTCDFLEFGNLRPHVSTYTEGQLLFWGQGQGDPHPLREPHSSPI